MTRAQVALALGVTQNTVGTLAARVYRKLGVRTRLELAHALRALGGADGGT
jgi:DNA-binding CsgD family transcriptional regulator